MKQNSQTEGAEATETSRLQTAPHETTDPILRAQEEFRADLSKKLRTPLNDIMGYAELLATPAATTNHDDCAQEILGAAKRLLAIVDALLVASGAPATIHNQSRGSSAPPCDVLYIEDEPANAVLVERTLRQRPALRYRHASTAEVGLDLARNHVPRLILLDLNLPDMEGSEVLRRLQQEATTAHIPVVVISADATASQIERLLTAGARDYLTKPFDIQNLLGVVDQVIDPN